MLDAWLKNTLTGVRVSTAYPLRPGSIEGAVDPEVPFLPLESPQVPAGSVYIGAAGQGTVYLGAAAISSKYLGAKTLF